MSASKDTIASQDIPATKPLSPAAERALAEAAARRAAQKPSDRP